MDFWSRLIGGTGNSTLPKQGTVNDPHQRLTRFKRVHNQLLIHHKKNHLASDTSTSDKALLYIETLRRTLQDEIQSPAPHPCIAFVVSSRAYCAVISVALSFLDERLVLEGLAFLNLLVDNEEGCFLEDAGFANTLIGFVSQISSYGSVLASAQVEGDIVEILFEVAAKLKLQPEILSAWFRPNRDQEVEDTPSALSGAAFSPSARSEFPLFYLLIDYVHHDGRVGDFARTGLLCLVGSANHTEELEKWIVESDLATLIASGLGALYSRLSRKLALSFPENSVPIVVVFSEVSRLHNAGDTEETGSAAFQSLLETFISYLLFWQDILEQCPSNDIKQTLLDHFHLLFLRQLLYPSLLESSDADGSSVAVLTYLRCILECVSYPDLVRLIMRYLLALPDARPEDLSVSRPTTLARRRKSQTLMTNLEKGEEKPSPNLFTLVDLILTSLQSHNNQTVTATLRLCSIIVSHHHEYAISSLLQIQATDTTNIRRTLDVHDIGLNLLLSVAEDLGPAEGLEESYPMHLHDVRCLLEAHCCSAKLLALPGMEVFLTPPSEASQVQFTPKAMKSHVIADDDPFLQHLLSLLKNFFINDIETNLALSQTFTTLASCGYTGIDAWLLGTANNEEDGKMHDISPTDNITGISLPTDRFSASSDEGSTNGLPPTEPSSLILRSLKSLLKQVNSCRHNIQDFDIYLSECKHIFRVNEEIESALTEPPTTAPSRKTQEPNPSSLAPSSSRHHISIPQRLWSGASTSTSTTTSRATSPRGRRPTTEPSASTLVNRLTHLKVSPSPNPSNPTTARARPYSASALGRDSPSPRTVTPMGPPDALRQKITVSTNSDARVEHGEVRDMEASESNSVRSEAIDVSKEITLGHFLTNVIILQEFVLELAALVEVRAGLFGEIDFS